jgi:zinc/manganese transport system substrate-binding protein
VRPGRGSGLAGLALAAALLTSGCSHADDADGGGQLSVVASTNVYADIASTVGGQYVETTAFIDSPDQDPHSYEASGRDILAVKRSDLVIENGGGYDDFMVPLVESAGGHARVLNVVDGSGLPDRDAADFNEHVWYNLTVVQGVARQIATELADLDPQHASDFRSNAAAFDKRLQRLIDREGELRGALTGLPVAVTEPVPGYMLDALGLDDLTPEAFTEAVEEGNDVAVSTLAETLDLAKDHQIDAVVYNEQTTGLITDQFLGAARDAGIPRVGVTETLPENADYLSWMSDNLDRIAGALGA